MFMRSIIFLAVLVQLSACLATPRLVSKRVSDYEPPARDESGQIKKTTEQPKELQDTPKVIVIKKEDSSI